MGRPSKKAERTEEIFQAFQRCVIRYGLEGSTLERIAEESGLQRSLVRHYVGNRADLVNQLADRAIQQSDQQWQELQNYLPEKDVTPVLLHMLFEYEGGNSEISLIFQALLFSASQDAELKQKLADWAEANITVIYDILRIDYPQAETEQLRAAAFGLISIYFNLDSMSPLGLISNYRQPAVQAARQLLNTL